MSKIKVVNGKDLKFKYYISYINFLNIFFVNSFVNFFYCLLLFKAGSYYVVGADLELDMKPSLGLNYRSSLSASWVLELQAWAFTPSLGNGILFLRVNNNWSFYRNSWYHEVFPESFFSYLVMTKSLFSNMLHKFMVVDLKV